MTTIKYTERNNIVKISLDGHAGFNPGNDPVCAGISTITYQMLNVLNKYQEKGIIDDFGADVEPGHTVISFHVYDNPTWDLAWDVIRTGYENIASAYPNNVWLE